ncbi:hypothetical protein [Aquihabitans sp. McL0605]|uniref:hypothetical protein n=1 Tax=Aquihabitans sp. McL0605 TaxID=3415671 RepID=UPI003CF64C69
MVVGVAVVAGGLAAAGVLGSHAEHPGSRAPKTLSGYATTPGDPSVGPLTPVLDRAGRLAGYVRTSAFDAALDEGTPTLTLASGRITTHGYPVRSRAGDLVGYYLVPAGFVDLSTATDPSRLRAIIAKGGSGPGATSGH